MEKVYLIIITVIVTTIAPPHVSAATIGQFPNTQYCRTSGDIQMQSSYYPLGDDVDSVGTDLGTLPIGTATVTCDNLPLSPTGGLEHPLSIVLNTPGNPNASGPPGLLYLQQPTLGAVISYHGTVRYVPSNATFRPYAHVIQGTLRQDTSLPGATLLENATQPGKYVVTLTFSATILRIQRYRADNGERQTHFYANPTPVKSEPPPFMFLFSSTYGGQSALTDAGGGPFSVTLTESDSCIFKVSSVHTTLPQIMASELPSVGSRTNPMGSVTMPFKCFNFWGRRPDTIIMYLTDLSGKTTTIPGLLYPLDGEGGVGIQTYYRAPGQPLQAVPLGRPITIDITDHGELNLSFAYYRFAASATAGPVAVGLVITVPYY